MPKIRDKEELLALLETTFAGRPWYGKNLQDSLNDVPVGKALLRLSNSYNIVETPAPYDCLAQLCHPGS